MAADYILDPERKRRVRMQLREAKTVSEIKVDGYDLVFDPHAGEMVRRYCATLLESGELELTQETVSSMTGNQTKLVRRGAMKMTAKGIRLLTEENKAALEHPEEPEPVTARPQPQPKKYPPLR